MYLYLGKETRNALSHLMEKKMKSPLSTNMLAPELEKIHLS